MNIKWFFLLIGFFSLFLAKEAQAQYAQPEVEVERIIVDKLVNYPDKKDKGGKLIFVDNLSPSDPKFSTGRAVFFKIRVRNASGVEMRDIQVVDYLPSQLIFVGSPQFYRREDHSVRFVIQSLAPGEVKDFIIQTKVKALADQQEKITCVANRAEARSETAADEDTAQFCLGLEKGPEVPTELPKTGAPALLSILLGLGAGAGFGIRRFVNRL